MPWQVNISRAAARDLARLPERDYSAIRRALALLETDPGLTDLKKLGGRTHEWRLRVGRWRVLLELDNAAGTVNVTHVLPRDRAYRD